MLAYGFKTELLVELVNAGLATATIDRMVVGGRRVTAWSSAGAGSKSSACGLLRLAGGRLRSFDGPDPQARRRLDSGRFRSSPRTCGRFRYILRLR